MRRARGDGDLTSVVWEIVGLVGFTTNVAGNLMLAYKRRGGWTVRLVPNIWAAYAINF